MFVVELTGRRVHLSPPTVTDIDRITACCQDRAVGEWTSMPSPYSVEDAKRFVTRVAPRGWADRSPTWAVRERSGDRTVSGPVVGMVGLMAIDDTAAEIGFWLAPDARGRGLMTDAVHAVCRFGFAPDGMGLTRLEWRAFVGNHASANVARRAGFRFEGTMRAGLVQRGQRRDGWIGARLATDPADTAPEWPI